MSQSLITPGCSPIEDSPGVDSAIAMTESEDSFVLQAACAISFDSIDSLCNIAQSQQSLESLTSLDSIPPRCYSLSHNERKDGLTNSTSSIVSITGNTKRFNTWTKFCFPKSYSTASSVDLLCYTQNSPPRSSRSQWRKKYQFRSENNLLDISPDKIKDVFRKTIRIKPRGSIGKISTAMPLSAAPRNCHSCDGLDTLGQANDNKTMIAVVTKGSPNGLSVTPLSYCTKNSLWFPDKVTSSSDSLFIGQRQDFRSVCWSQQRRKSDAVFVTGTADELKFSGTAEELRFEETEEVHSRVVSRRLSDIGDFAEIAVKIRVPASILCSKKGFGKEILFQLSPKTTLFFVWSEVNKFTNKSLLNYKLCPGLLLQECIDFWKSEDELNLNKEIELCTATEEAPTLHFRVITKDLSEMRVKVMISLPPMTINAAYFADSTTADLLSNVINSTKLSETEIKRNMQKFGLYHPRYKTFLRTDELVSFYDISQYDVLELKTRQEGVCEESLYLHVDVQDEERTVCVVTTSNVSVSDLISKILGELSTGTEDKWHYYGIYLPSNQHRQGGWMDDFKMLHSYSLEPVDKVELRARFRLFIFDLQVYSSSQHYTRHFVNMYISDRITAGEVLKIITGTNCLDYPTSWYGVFLHDNERIADDAKLCQSLEGKGISKQDSLVVHMVHQPLHVSLEGEEDTSHTFMLDFSTPLQQLHVVFCRYYGIRVPATCILQHNDIVLDVCLCAIKNKLSPNSSIVIHFKRVLSPVSPVNGRIPRQWNSKRASSSSSPGLSSVKSTSSLTNAAIDTTDPLSAARLESDKKCKSMDLLKECSKPTSDKPASKGECTFYENTDKMSDLSLDDPPSTLSLDQSGERSPVASPLQSPVVARSLVTGRRSPLPTRRTPSVEKDGSVVLRKSVERVKRAQSKIYEEDDVNIWDDESDPAKTLIRDENKDVKSGTFNRFVELLTDTQNYKINFVKVFLLTYQAFTTPKQLLRKLIQRYNVPRNDDITFAEFVKYRTSIQNGVINALKLWVTDGDDFEGNPILQKDFMHFIHSTVSHDNPQQYRILRQKLLLVRGMVRTRNITRCVAQSTPPLKLPSNLSPNATLFDHGPTEIARQLTMLDFALFSKIKPIELVNQAWVKPKYSHQAKNILHFAERMNTLTRWTATSILSRKDRSGRAKMITDFVHIAAELFKLNNFSSFIAIINALEGSAISRLQASWNKVDRKTCQRNDDLYEMILPNCNFRTLRAKISEADPPCIPYVGLFMSDLTFATECNPTVVDCMVNFVKCKYINDIINRLKLYQQKTYQFEVVPSILAPLQSLHALDEETLYKMSLQVEPKKCKG